MSGDDSDWWSGIIVLALWLLLAPLVALGVEACWNSVMPYVFHLPRLGYGQSFALAILIALLK